MIVEQIAKLGGKLAQLLGESSESSGSPSLSQLRKYFEHYRLHDLLPYRGFDPKTKLFHNEASVGFVIECHPMVGCSEEMQREISGLFQHTLPEASNIQFLLWADPRVRDILQQWSEPRRRQGELFAKLASKRAEYIDSLVFASASTPVRNFRCLVSYSQKGDLGNPLDLEKIVNLKEQVLTSLKTLGVPVVLLEAEGLLNFLDGIVNFNYDTTPSKLAWNPHTPLNEQIPCPGNSIRVSSAGLLLPEMRETATDNCETANLQDGHSPNDYTVKAYSVRREPDQWSLHAMGELIGDDFRDLMRVHCPFLLHYGVHISNQETTKARIQSRESWVETQARSKIGKKIPILVDQHKELDFVRHQLSRGERFVQTSFSALLFSKSEASHRHDQVLNSLFRSKRWQLAQEKYLHLPVFLSCLPMCWGEGFAQELGYQQRLKTTLSTESANLLPVQGEWKGTTSPGILFVGRKGQLFTWSPFDNNAGNYNVCVVGRSGAGKSVFMQELMTSTLGQGGQVFVLDVGRSFEKTVKLLGGEYIEFKPQSDICINPFSSIPTDDVQVTADALAMLKPIVSLMAAPREGTGDLENAHIEQAIKQAWEAKNTQATMTDVAEVLSSHADLIAKNLGQKLFPYTRHGTYGRFFNGASTVNLSAKMVVVELEELKERKDLQSVVVQMVILQITNKLYLGDRKTLSNLVLDEAWDMLRGKQSGEFIETAARRLRKYQGSLVVGTQTVNDFYATPGAQAAFDNSDWMCLLSQKKESIEQLKQTSRISMDPNMESMLTSVQTRQGEYAEVMLYGPHGYAVGRFIPDPYSLVLYSTKPEEFAAVQDQIAKGLPMSEAIEAVASGRMIHAS
ncbi:MAG: type IV secretion system protein TraC [Pseudomonadota bacterium]